MNKVYCEPIIEVVKMDFNDIITASPLTEGNVVEVPWDEL